MRPYLLSLVIGLAVGLFYGLLKVRLPAPPAIALLGLLGMLIGEQVVPLVRSYALWWEGRRGSEMIEPLRPGAVRGPTEQGLDASRRDESSELLSPPQHPSKDAS